MFSCMSGVRLPVQSDENLPQASAAVAWGQQSSFAAAVSLDRDSVLNFITSTINQPTSPMKHNLRNIPSYRFANAVRSQLILSFASLLFASPLLALDYYWDANGAAANTGGTGTWATANTWRDSTDTGALGNWVDGNTAIFGGTAGTTTVGANVAVKGMTFNVANHVVGGTAKVNFGTGGNINFGTTTNGIKLAAPLAGTVTIALVAGNLTGATTAFIKANSPDLLSVTLSGNDPNANRNVILDHVGAFGPDGASVTISNALLGLGALTGDVIGSTNGSGGGLSFNAWNLSMTGVIRSRAGANTINSPTTLTGNSTLLTRGFAGVKLIFSNTATINLGANTLLLSPITASSGIELNGAISGTGGVTQGDTTLTGAGTVGAADTSTLAGANTYTGPTAINKGTLNLTGSLTSNIAIASGAGIKGEGSTTGSVTFAGTSTLTFNPVTTGALTAASVDASAATITLAVAGIGAGGTGIVILDAPGGITGTVGTNFLFTGNGTVYLSPDNTKLLFDYTPRTIIWQGTDATNPSFWDINTTTNWLFTGAPDKFFTNDSVVFDDTATSFTVTAQGTNVQPGTMLINNDTVGHEYLFNGAPISGPTSLTKQGSQKAILATNNTYTGGTTISAGTLQLGDGVTATGSAGTGDIVDNAALIVNSGVNNRTLLTNVSGTGTLNYSGTALFNIAANVTIAGNTTIDSGNLQIGNGSFVGNVTGPIVNNATLSFNRVDAITLANAISGTGNVSKTLGASVTLTGANSFTGTVSISGGNQVLVAGSNTALGANAGGTIVGLNSRLELANGVSITGETVEITGGGGNFNGALQAQAGATATWDGPIRTNSADARIGTGVGGTLTVSGAIQDGTANAINFGSGVNGTGTVIVATPAGGNTYTGPTNLVRGTVKLGAANSLPATTTLDVDSNTANEACIFDLNGFNQTVAGLKRGNATGGTATLTNSSATAATLTVNQSVTTIYDGAVNGNLALVKDGTGTLNLAGVIAYTGNTTITAGTLSFSQAGLSDTSTVTIAAGAVAALNFTGNDRVGSLVINGSTLPDGVYTNTSHGGIYAAYLTGAGALQVGEIGYVPWIAGFPTLTGDAALPTADPDNDGVANLLEFVLGGTPTMSDASILPTAAIDAGGLNLLLSFKRSDLSQTDTTLVLQIGTDLATWPPSSEVTIGPVSDVTGTLPGEVAYVITENAEQPDDIVITIPNGIELRKFIRIKATKP
jgi:autotransporter-associated beta strand protein